MSACGLPRSTPSYVMRCVQSEWASTTIACRCSASSDTAASAMVESRSWRNIAREAGYPGKGSAGIAHDRHHGPHPDGGPGEHHAEETPGARSGRAAEALGVCESANGQRR